MGQKTHPFWVDDSASIIYKMVLKFRDEVSIPKIYRKDTKMRYQLNRSDVL